MSWATLIWRSLTYHARAHLGVLAGAIIATAALAGALVLGDSVRAGLREAAVSRLGKTYFALNTGDRFFEDKLAGRIRENLVSSATTNPTPREGTRLAEASFTTALLLPGMITAAEQNRTAPRVQVLGVDPKTWPEYARWQPGDDLKYWLDGTRVFINEALAGQLKTKAGDTVLVRVRKPGLLADDAALTPRDENTVVLRLEVGRVLKQSELGGFDLRSGRPGQPNAFLPLPVLAAAIDQTNRANLLLAGFDDSHPTPPSDLPSQLAGALQSAWRPADAGLIFRVLPLSTNEAPGRAAAQVEVATSRIFLEEPVIKSLQGPGSGDCLGNPRGIFTYLVNLLRAGDRTVPYSMVAATSAPELVPAGMQDDEIVLNDWLARELAVQPGDTLDFGYYVVESGASLIERTNRFRVHSVVPMQGPHSDRSLMPEFPGIARAESTHDWDTGFPLRYPIRPVDEEYWKQHRGTPKAYITLAAGQRLWSNRFGSLTALRFPVPEGSRAETCLEQVEKQVRTRLPVSSLGFRFESVREQALRAASQAQDFGQLFLGFSFFLVLSALLLMALLFRFALEQRASETGLLLAVGFRSSQAGRLILGEGLLLALIGGLSGAVIGAVYANGLLAGLRTIWREAAGGLHFQLQLSPASLLTSAIVGTVIAVLTVWLSLRGFTRRPVQALLSGETGMPISRKPRFAWLTAVICAVGGLLLVLQGSGQSGAGQAPAFFGAGALLLISGLAVSSAWLARLGTASSSQTLTLTTLGARGCGRRRGRSLATIALLACGTFMIAGPSVFRLNSRDETSRSSGTGGFRLLVETAIPVVQNLNTPAGRDFFNLPAKVFEGATIVPLRVQEGDEASCLTLNRAQRPRLLGADPELLRGRFTFVSPSKSAGWDVLRAPSTSASDPIPAVGDANAVQWAMGKKVGDLLEYTDEHGRTFQVRIAGAIANSILQGSLLIDEAALRARFPSSSGARMLLLDVPQGQAAETEKAFSRALEDYGVEVSSTVERLNDFNAVQNTYLATFQVLGGLGLLLGSAGLGIVVLRNVFERRSELAVMTALGLTRRTLIRLVLVEHLLLLAAGLGLGVLAACIAVLPAIMRASTDLPVVFLSSALALVFMNGLFWTWLATRTALRSPLLPALRNE